MGRAHNQHHERALRRQLNPNRLLSTADPVITARDTNLHPHTDANVREHAAKNGFLLPLANTNQAAPAPDIVAMRFLASGPLARQRRGMNSLSLRARVGAVEDTANGVLFIGGISTGYEAEGQLIETYRGRSLDAALAAANQAVIDHNAQQAVRDEFYLAGGKRFSEEPLTREHVYATLFPDR